VFTVCVTLILHVVCGSSAWFSPLQCAFSCYIWSFLLPFFQQSHSEFSRAKTQNQSGLAREKQLKDLAMAYDSFMDLKSNIEEGIKVWRSFKHFLTSEMPILVITKNVSSYSISI
jgi:hypothetical protein